MNKYLFTLVLMFVALPVGAQSIIVNVDGKTYNDVQSLVNNPNDLLKAIQITTGDTQKILTDAYYSQVYQGGSNNSSTQDSSGSSGTFSSLPASLQGKCTGSMANQTDALACAAKAEAQGMALGYNIDCSVNPITINGVTSSYYPDCTVNGSAGHSAYLLAGFESGSTMITNINSTWNLLPSILAYGTNSQTSNNQTYSNQGYSASNQLMSGSGSSLSNVSYSGSTSYSQSVAKLLSSAVSTLNSAYSSAGSSGSYSSTGSSNSNSGSGSSSSSCTVTVTAPLLNVRQSPITSGPVVSQLAKGATFTGVATVEGENVEGTSQWWRTNNGSYVWAGGTSQTSCGSSSNSGSGTNSGSGSGTTNTGAMPSALNAIGPVYARYIKVQTESRSWVAWREIEVYNLAGDKVAAVSATASCTWCRWTSADPGVGPEKAIDGNTGTVWNAGETNPACNWFGTSASDRAACGVGGQSAWIQIDLGSNVNVSKIRLMTENTPNPSQATHTVSASQNVGSFAQVASFSGMVNSSSWLEINVQ